MDTKTRLMDSAERAVRQRGYNGFSYADLSREVGIRKASIHHHFPTKNDLALAIMERYRHRFFSALRDILIQHTRASNQLQSYLGIYREALQDGTSMCLCVAFSADRASLSDTLHNEIAHFHDASVAWLEEVFARAHSDQSVSNVSTPHHEAAACLALVEGGQLVARASKDVTLFDRALTLFVHRIR